MSSLMVVASQICPITISRQFKEWAEQKGVEYLKRGRAEDHIKEFERKTELRIPCRTAHRLIARLVRQHNRKKGDAKQGGVVAFVYLPHPLLRVRRYG